MFYKVTDKSSQVYKDLAQLRAEELAMQERNLAKINELTGGLEWDEALTIGGPSSIRRVPNYKGFVFKNPGLVDITKWTLSKYAGVFIPNTKTKAGRAIKEALDELESTYYFRVLEALKVSDYVGKFTIPLMTVENEIVLLRLDDNREPKIKEVEEITSIEFKKLLGIGKDEEI